MDTTLNEGDSIIAISEDDDALILNDSINPTIKTHLFQNTEDPEIKEEKTLVLGWNKDAKTTIRELDDYVAKNSTVTVVHDDEIDISTFALKNQHLQIIKGKKTDKKTLENIHPESYDHIIVLSNFELEIQESDAQTIICLLHLRNIGKKYNKNLSIVSEMRDIRNREIGVVAQADDFIVGDNIISLMLSQISENKNLKNVFDELFKSEGSEIYLKPIVRYIKPNEHVDFYTLLERASELSETAIGYRIIAEKENPEMNFGIKVNPNKSDTMLFTENDFLIVLSED